MRGQPPLHLIGHKRFWRVHSVISRNGLYVFLVIFCRLALSNPWILFFYLGQKALGTAVLEMLTYKQKKPETFVLLEFH
jgi:hypothetical protein